MLEGVDDAEVCGRQAVLEKTHAWISSEDCNDALSISSYATHCYPLAYNHSVKTDTGSENCTQISSTVGGLNSQHSSNLIPFSPTVGCKTVAPAANSDSLYAMNPPNPCVSMQDITGIQDPSSIPWVTCTELPYEPNGNMNVRVPMAATKSAKWNQTVWSWHSSGVHASA